MPIRINLKELISSDSQEIAIDKINFNFNKLLELGIGELGLTGKTGSVGSAGPVGPEGGTGIRGSSWYVDAAADPNSLSFTDLVIGDFYLSSERISIWRWNGVQWQFIADLSNVVNNYLAESPSPFVRGLGLGSSKDNRFILFSRRGNTEQDIIDDQALSNSSNNDILFLNNFNEETINTLLLDQVPPGFEYGPASSPTSNQVATSTLFNSLASIYADHYNSGTFGRYHLELGSLYEFDPDNLNGEPILSETKHNLKIRFLKDTISSPNFPLTNSLINIARFNLSKPELSAITEIDQNGVYEFITSSFNQEGGTPEQEEVTLRLGGAKGLGEYSIAGVEPTDGIYLQSGASHAFTIGMVKSFTQSINETTYSANLTEDVIYFSKSTTPSLSWLFDGKLKIKGNLFVNGSSNFGGTLTFFNNSIAPGARWSLSALAGSTVSVGNFLSTAGYEIRLGSNSVSNNQFILKMGSNASIDPPAIITISRTSLSGGQTNMSVTTDFRLINTSTNRNLTFETADGIIPDGAGASTGRINLLAGRLGSILIETRGGTGTEFSGTYLNNINIRPGRITTGTNSTFLPGLVRDSKIVLERKVQLIDNIRKQIKSDSIASAPYPTARRTYILPSSTGNPLEIIDNSTSLTDGFIFKSTGYDRLITFDLFMQDGAYSPGMCLGIENTPGTASKSFGNFQILSQVPVLDLGITGKNGVISVMVPAGCRFYCGIVMREVVTANTAYSIWERKFGVEHTGLTAQDEMDAISAPSGPGPSP
jgi:hypothetical protein